MTIGSLFAGIGGLELGLERAGLGPVVWQVETDPFCRAVLAKHWPDADRSVTDVRSANATNLAPVDIVCGGFPCQDISLAGSGKGLAGERSGLWWEFLRIVQGLRPRFVVIENVSALRSRGLDSVLGSLAACGYDALWSTLRASDVGAPHRRERLFVVAHDICHGLERHEQEGATPGPVGGGREVADPDGNSVRFEQQRQPRRRTDGVCDEGQAIVGTDGTVADTDVRRCEVIGKPGRERRHEGAPRHEPNGCNGARQGKAQPGLGRNADGLPGGLDGRDRNRWPTGPGVQQHGWEPARTLIEKSPIRNERLKALGNAVVPQCAEVIGHVIQGLTQ